MDVAAWLRGLGLGQYEQAFRENDIDLEVLADLTVEDLIGLGVTTIGHRRKFLAAAATLRTDSFREKSSPEGIPVTPSGTPLPPSMAERRQITVLFYDLVGSTALATRHDPEDVREAISAFHHRIGEAIVRFGGFVVRMMGDGALACFGYPQAHEDDAERAVRAGLAAINAVTGLALPDGRAAQVRIGIATGLAVVGEVIGPGKTPEDDIAGETPNLAARLQTIAAPGSAVISHTTRQLVGGLFELADLGLLRLKGFSEPVAAWQVKGEGRAEGRFEAMHGELLTPMVGREHELGILLERWAWAKDGDGQVVLLTGEPGIGKSRLIQALRERLRNELYTPLGHYCSPYHTNSALYPVIRLLERAMRLDREDSPEEQAAKLEALLGRTSDRLDEVVPLLATLLGIQISERYSTLTLAPEVQKQRMLEALIDQLASLAAQQPVLAFYEDVHWVDPSTLELLNLVVERIWQLPVLVLITFRPEFQAPWIGQAHITTLFMSRLGRRQGSDLVAWIAGDKSLPAEVVEEIVARTDGVPLFVEELTKTVLDSGLLSKRNDRYVLDGPLPPLAIPTTLQASLIARLDRLAALKVVAQTAAVIGREFHYELLAAVNELPATDLHRALDRLVEGGLVFRRGTPPNAAYLFKHALVRDAIYESCLKSHRKRLHSRIAQALIDYSTFAAASEVRSPETIAQHYLAADDLTKALPYILAAGKGLAARFAYVEALRWFEKGAEVLRLLASDDEQLQRFELDLYLAWMPVLMTYPGFTNPQTLIIAEHADTLCQRFGEMDRLVPVLFAKLNYYGAGGGSLVQALEIATRIQHHGETSDDAVALLVGYRTQGFCFLWMGQLMEAEAALRNALEQAPRTPAGLAAQFGHDPETTALALLGSVEQRLGRICRGGETLRAALAKAQGLGHPLTYAYVVRHASVSAATLKDYALVEWLAGQLTEVCKKYGIRQWEPLGALMQAWAVSRSGTGTCECSILEALLEEHRARGFRRNLPFYLTMVAEVVLDHCGSAKAKPMIDEAAALAREMSETWAEPELFGLAARLHAEEGGAVNVAEQERLLRLSHDAAKRQGAKLVELRAATSLARLWREQGKHSEARDFLAPIHGWFTEGFDTPDLQEAKALLCELRGTAPQELT